MIRKIFALDQSFGSAADLGDRVGDLFGQEDRDHDAHQKHHQRDRNEDKPDRLYRCVDRRDDAVEQEHPLVSVLIRSQNDVDDALLPVNHRDHFSKGRAEKETGRELVSVMILRADFQKIGSVRLHSGSIKIEKAERIHPMDAAIGKGIRRGKNLPIRIDHHRAELLVGGI